MDQETLKTILVIPAGVIFVGLFVFVMSCFDMSVFDEAEKQARQKARERRRQENERLWQMEEQKRAKQKAQELEQKRKNILSHEDFYAQGITGDLIKLETLAVEVVNCVIKQPRVHFN